MNRIRIQVGDWWRNLWIALGNLIRRASARKIDYVVIDLAGALPEYLPPPQWWQKYLPPLPGLPAAPDGMSLTAFRNILERIALDPKPRGVILRLDGFAPPGWATANSARDAILRFRQKSKRVVAYADEYSNVAYYVASAADQIVLPPGGSWEVFGLRLELTFLKDALAAYGVQAEVVNVSPYKTAGDTFSRSDVSPEHREMLNWILDGQYEEIVGAMAAGRKMEAARVRELIDSAPRLANEAKADGLVDAVCYFDELPALLEEEGSRRKEAEEAGHRKKPKKKSEEEIGAKLVTWAAASQTIAQPTRWRSGKAIGVIALEGTIIPGKSQRLPAPIPLPFVGNTLAGSESVSQALRRAEKDDHLAAVVFYVDSRGGSAVASDLIWRETARLRKKKPVVAYMANYAASGGYYVSAGANWIVAQPLTVTGSIGVILMKFVIAGLLERFRANQVVLERGAHAGLFSPVESFGEAGRTVARQMIDGYYRQFMQVVGAGRKMDEAKLEPNAGGRVWLGRQALDRGLVDQLGDFSAAIEKARELAQLKPGEWTPPVWIGPGRGGLLPPPFPAQSWEAWSELLAVLRREKCWMIAPFDLIIMV